jgi:OPA family glycerol-3-phosphate transporter-like MFS transporter
MSDAFTHSSAFKLRRFANWFPMGLTYALLYMGRYNLTVAKNALGDLLTKEDFGLIFGAGTAVYAISFLINGPLIDRIGGRKGILLAACGTAIANGAIAAYLAWLLATGEAAGSHIVVVLSLLYAVNMYFQSFGAVSIVKVNAHWFHLRERGGFSGIFGTMIASGIFLAFTVNSWMLDFATASFPGARVQWVVFAVPALLLAAFAVVELFLLRDKPSAAGFPDFDTGDASSGEDDKPLPTLQVFKRLLTNPIILTVAAIEFCTGVVRQGVMHWFPIYATEVWVLPKAHPLQVGSWEHAWLIGVCFAVAGISWVLASRLRAARRGMLVVLGALAFLAPFLQAGWGGLLFVAGVIGANTAGWISDLFFQSRRGPTAAVLYALMILCAVGMTFALAKPSNEVATAKPESGLLPGDRIVELAGRPVTGWADVRLAAKCVVPSCAGSRWNAAECVCSTGDDEATPAAAPPAGSIPARVVRGGRTISLDLADPLAVQRAGEMRKLAASPVLPISPYWLGLAVFLLSLGVIGTHGLLSGTLTMDFGGRKAAATAVGLIDGCVYLGTALQSVCLGFLTTKDWSYWPIFLIPFSVLGFVLLLRIWKVVPSKRGAH